MSILKKLAVDTSKTAFCAITLLAIATPEQAQAAGVVFSNVRVNNIQIPQGSIFIPTTITSPDRTFNFAFDVYNNSGSAGDSLAVSFFGPFGGNLDRPVPPATTLAYTGRSGSRLAPATLTYSTTFTESGNFVGGFTANLINSNPDYDPTPPNGAATVTNPQFFVNLVTAEPPTPVPFEFSPGLGILALGACGALAKLNSSVRKLKFSGSAFSNQQ